MTLVFHVTAELADGAGWIEGERNGADLDDLVAAMVKTRR
jgi:hypothetical protein